MAHIGIDLGSKDSPVRVRTSAGELLEEPRCHRTNSGGSSQVQTAARVALETCTEAFRVAGSARQQGHAACEAVRSGSEALNRRLPAPPPYRRIPQAPRGPSA